MEPNIKENLICAVQSIQKVWRGYLGRKLITRIQLHNERDKLKLSRYQRTVKKKLVSSDNILEQQKSSQEKNIPISEIDDIIVYKALKKSSKLGSYDGSNYNPNKNHVHKLNIINNNSSFHTSLHENKQINRFAQLNMNEIPFEFVPINTGLLSNIEEEDDELLVDSLQSTALLCNDQSQKHGLNLNQSIKSIDSLELNSSQKKLNVATNDDLNLEDSLNIQSDIIHKTNQFSKNNINTITSSVNSSYNENNNLYNQNPLSPQRKSLRIVKNDNILLDTSQSNHNINQPKIPSMQDLLALSPMKSIALLLSPSKDKIKLTSNISRNISESQIDNNPQIQNNFSDKLKSKSQLELAQEIYESNVRKNFPKINPQQISTIHPSSPSKLVSNHKQNDIKPTSYIFQVRNEDRPFDNELHYQELDNNHQSKQQSSNTYQSKLNHPQHIQQQEQQQYQSNSHHPQNSEENHSMGFKQSFSDHMNRNKNKPIEGYLNQMNVPPMLDKEHLNNPITKSNHVSKLDTKGNIQRQPLLKPYEKNVLTNVITPVSGSINCIDPSKPIYKKYSNLPQRNHLAIPNKSNNIRLDQSTLQELQELKLLEEIDQLNKIQLQKIKELTLIEKQEQKYLKVNEGITNKNHSNNNNDNKSINEKRNKIKEIDLTKEKEKKAFGPGARDMKPSKPLSVPPSTKQNSNQMKRVIVSSQQQQQYQDDVISNNIDMIKNKNKLQNPSNVIVHEWQNALLKENETNKVLIPENPIHEINEVYYNSGIGYLQEYHKKRENKQRNHSNPRNNSRREGYGESNIQDNNSIAKSEDVRLFQHREKQQLVGRKTQQNHHQLEETMSLPTILPTRNIKSSNGFIISSQYADMIVDPNTIDPMKAFIGQSHISNTNRNTTMSAPSRVCNNNSPLLVLPSLKKVQQQPSNVLPLLGIPIANRKLAK